MFSIQNFPGIIFLISILLISACSDETTNPVLTGDISGFVKLYARNGNSIDDKSNVVVSIEGTNYKTTTNSDGRYLLKFVNAGIYNIVFEKEGFGTNKLIAKEFPGGGQAYYGRIFLTRLPTDVVTDLSFTPSETDTFKVGEIKIVTSHTEQEHKLAVIYINNQPEVSADPQNYLFFDIAYITQGDTLSYTIWKQYLPNKQFPSGSLYYIAAYTTNSPYSYYPDPNTGKYYFTPLSKEKKVISSVVP